MELESIAAEINREHQLCYSVFRTSLEHAMRAGELLVQAKEQVSHGQWLPWVEANCEFARNTATGYMQLHSYRELLNDRPVDHLGVREAIAYIAKQTLQQGKSKNIFTFPNFRGNEQMQQFFRI